MAASRPGLTGSSLWGPFGGRLAGVMDTNDKYLAVGCGSHGLPCSCL